MKKAILYSLSFIGGLYTVFVMQHLWNWFAVDVITVSRISFLNMLGLVILADMLLNRVSKIKNFQSTSLCKLASYILNTCLPEAKKEAVEKFLTTQRNNISENVGIKTLGVFLRNTGILVIGGVIYNVMMYGSSAFSFYF